jgi:hypothetical protein
MTKANNRVFEPEFRIVLVVFQLSGAAVGLFAFGVSVDNNWSYYLSIILFAFVTFALIMGATATGTYIVDAHLEMAVEAFVCITLFKNFVSFGMTLHVFDLLLNVGETKVWFGSFVITDWLDFLYSWRGSDGSVSFEYPDVYLWEVLAKFL